MDRSQDLAGRARARAATRRSQPDASDGWVHESLDLVAEAAAKWPDRQAIADRQGAVTYRELDSLVQACAARLAKHEVGPESPVLIVVQNDIASVAAIHGALRAGALVLVAPSTAGRAQLSDIVDLTRPVARFALDDLIGGDLLPGAGNGWVPLSTLTDGGEASASCLVSDRPADEPAIVIFTSGTTSRPKGVIHSLSTLLVASRTFIKRAELDADDCIFVVSPLASITGIQQSVVIPPMLGARIVLESKWDPVGTFDLLADHGGTFFGGPDLVLDRLLAEAESRGDTTTTIESVYLGGSMLDPRILARVEDQFGIVVMRAYGSSEAPISTSGRRSEPREIRLADDGEPAIGVSVRRGSRADPAEFSLTGPHLFLGYVHEEDDNHAFEVDDTGRDWFCTGDVAELDGGRVKIVGRIRDIVIRNGLKVPLSEVEGYLNELPEIARCAGYSVPDAVTGERLAVAVIAPAGGTVVFDEVVAALLAAGLTTWKLPEELVLWDEAFPENVAGKVLKNRLHELSAGRPRLLAPRLRESEG